MLPWQPKMCSMWAVACFSLPSLALDLGMNCLRRVGRVRYLLPWYFGSRNVAMVTEMSITPRWSVEKNNTKYALPSLCMTWDSDPTLLTRAPREGQGPS